LLWRLDGGIGEVKDLVLALSVDGGRKFGLGKERRFAAKGRDDSS
jgi:hypothetical protein